jgi:hypothetical protein
MIRHISPENKILTFLFLLITILLEATLVIGQTVGDYRSDVANGNWTTISNWRIWNGTNWITSTTYPGQNSGTGNVVIRFGSTISLDLSPAFSIGSLNVGDGTNNNLGLSNNPAILSIGSNTLSVIGNVVISKSNSSRNGNLNNNTGTLKISGSLSIANGVYNCNTGTVDFNGGAQTIAALTYYNLTLSGSGTKTLSASQTISGDLEINSTAKASFTGNLNTANALYLNGVQQSSGTWGSNSSSAFNKNDSFFTGTGYVTITTGTCILPGITSATAAASPICSNTTTTLTANGVVGTNTVVTWWSGTGGTGTNYGTGLTLTNAGSGTYYARATGDCGSPAEASVTVEVRPTPTATISGTTSLCQNGVSPNVTFTNPQTLPVTITFNTNGSNQTTVNVPASSSATVAAPTSTAGTSAYNLVSVAYQTAPNCSNTITGTATITVNALPVPSLAPASSNSCQNDDLTYSTEPSQTNYNWAFPGSVLNTDYTIIAGGGTTNNTVTIKWLTAGSKTVAINYNNGFGCSGATPTNSTTTVNPIPVMGSFN